MLLILVHSVRSFVRSKEEAFNIIGDLVGKPDPHEVAKAFYDDPNSKQFKELQKQVSEILESRPLTGYEIVDALKQSYSHGARLAREREVVEEMIEILGYKNKSSQFLRAVRNNKQLYQMTEDTLLLLKYRPQGMIY